MKKSLMQSGLLVHICLCITVFVFSSCATTVFKPKNAAIHGKIYDVKGEPVTGVSILLISNKKEEDVKEVYSDSLGGFSFIDIKPDVYTLHFYGRQIEPYEYEVHVFEENHFVYVELWTIPSLLIEVDTAFKNGDYKKAKRCIQKIYAIDSENTNALMYEVLIASASGETEKAKRILEDAFENEIEDMWLKKTYEVLEIKK